MTLTLFFLVVFLALNAADAATTLYGIRNGMREANPLMAKLFAKVGVKMGLFIMKVPISIGAIYYVVVEHAPLLFVLALAIPYAILLVWNIFQLRRSGCLV